ncbi:AraC family transcriptional regulator [Edaphobacter aggregans]|uniref:AraC family transcriptional regulator n=1 Tax=Edaphobacter aggregans TaxID=570835 RepID=UPI0005592DC9|nr:AraC family transcriptional regulator [Edaphobacter aggregans]
MDCRKEQLLQGERTKFWRADDIGDVELLHARYLKHSFGRHTHEGLAVGVIRHGVESFTCMGSGHYAVADQIIVFNPEEVHTGEAADEKGWEFRIFYFDSELLRTAASLASGKQVNLPAFRNPIIDDPELALQICSLHAVLEIEESRLTRQELFLLTFAELAKRHADVKLVEPNRGLERQAVRRVREYLDANTRRNVALEDLSALSGLSPYHLIRVFRQELGLSPHAYFEQVRIHRARRLLKEGLAIVDVAVDLGFTDQSHLNRHFKKLTGVTPGAYRSATVYKTDIPQTP